jgi:CHAT domain-containing protein
MKVFNQVLLSLVLMLSSSAFASYQDDIKAGEEAFQYGNFEKAAEYWDKALSDLQPEKDIKSCIDNKKCIDTSVRLAAAYQSLGHLKRALKVLESARLLKNDDPKRKASILLQLGHVYLAMRDFQEKDMDCSMKGEIRPNPLTQPEILKKAWYYFEQAENAIGSQKNRYPLLLWANILNGKGNVGMAYSEMFSFQKSVDKAKAHAAGAALFYQKGIQYAKDDKVLKAKISINKVHALAKTGFYKVEELKTVLVQVQKLDDSHEKVFDLISLAQLFPYKQKSLAKDALKQAFTIAKTLTDKASLAYAKYYLAQLSAKDKDYYEAIQLTKQSILHAQSHICYSNSKLGDKMINYGEDSFVSDRFKVYLPPVVDETSLFFDTISEEDCKKMCQEQDVLPPSLQHIFSNNCKGICQDMSLLSTQNYYPELLFRLERQLGEYLEKQGKREGAIEAYRRAVKHLQFRQEARSLSQPFREMEKNTYFELVDLLLQQAAKVPASKKQALLKETIDNLESFKAAELRNYFQDECITEGLQDTLHLDNLPDNVAVFYPLLFEDRIELLVISNNEIQQKHPFPKDNISVEELKHKVIMFLEEDLKGRDHFDPENNALYVYNGVIKPIINVLGQKVDTLVIVPDATLRTIPFAALHDGNEFLVQKNVSLVVTPSIKLTVHDKMQRDNVWALLNGSEKFEEDEPLECVPLELRKVSCLLKDNTFIKDEGFAFKDSSTCVLKDSSICSLLESKISLLLNEDFTLSNVKEKLNNIPYSIVHFATHGFFNSDPNKTFLRTYDGRIRMSELKTLIRKVEKNFEYQPIELLTLSACQTATGDKNAALGLAGTALQTGVPSVLATLWNVADPATTQLISEFYRQLRKKPNSSKAKALQEAQKRLLYSEKPEDEYKKHPYYWASFLLIGNWL